MRFAVLGDLHGSIDAVDVTWLDAQRYDAVLVVGDLAGFRPGAEAAVARVLATLRTPLFMVPGNHDGVTMAQLGAEVTGRRGLADRLTGGMEDRVASLDETLGEGVLGGFSVHSVQDVRLVLGRPHTFGGPGLGCAAYLERAFGVSTSADSEALLLERLREAADHPVVVLAHTGPFGLGARRDAPCGRDFHREEGDWGDRDLAGALRSALAEGVDIRAVAFGHMHLGLNGGGVRQDTGSFHGIPCINAARVPRRTRDGWRHHVEISVDAEVTVVSAVRWRDGVVHRSTRIRQSPVIG